MMTGPNKATRTARAKTVKRLDPYVTRKKPSSGDSNVTTAVHIKRAYEVPNEADGYRVLVDRLWPRGVRKDELALDAWLKEVAPSDSLRRWYAHDPARFTEFAKRYQSELQIPEIAAALDSLAQRASSGPLTLVYGARDPRNNHALVLQSEIARRAHARSRRKTPVRRRSGS